MMTTIMCYNKDNTSISWSSLNLVIPTYDNRGAARERLASDSLIGWFESVGSSSRLIRIWNPTVGGIIQSTAFFLLFIQFLAQSILIQFRVKQFRQQWTKKRVLISSLL